MLTLKILENDLHRSKRETANPLIVEIPARPEFLPALVSNSVGEFLVARKMTGDGKIRTGVFRHDPEKIDQIIPKMLKAALDLSVAEQWPNVFGPTEFKKAFVYVKAESFMPAQPHVCLVPSAWDRDKLAKAMKTSVDAPKYQRYCRIVPIDIPFSVFLSKPDMVGLYTHFLNGGSSSILLHNVKKGMAFCAPRTTP